MQPHVAEACTQQASMRLPSVARRKRVKSVENEADQEQVIPRRFILTPLVQGTTILHPKATLTIRASLIGFPWFSVGNKEEKKKTRKKMLEPIDDSRC